MFDSTYLLLIILFLFTEAVLLLIHLQSHAEKTRQLGSFLDMENDKLNKKIEALQLTIQEIRRELDNKRFEMSSLKTPSK